jgi:lysophospholipid acyltransferase (LPLAT)-like uncharacterized protein
MDTTASRHALTVVTMITDPVDDDQSRRVVERLGCSRVEGSPITEGTPRGSRSVFELTSSELAEGGLEARIDHLAAHGIAVHRIVGEHPAVRLANRRLGYL